MNKAFSPFDILRFDRVYSDLSPSIIAFFTKTDFIVLILFAVVSEHIVEKFVGKSPWKRFAIFLAIPLALFLGLQSLAENSFQDSLEVAVTILVRWIVSIWIVMNCLVTPIVIIAQFLVRYGQREWNVIKRYLRELASLYGDHRKKPAPITEYAPPPPRESKMLQDTERARLDYEFECRILDGAALDDEEKEVALDQAKQKYVQRLRNALQ